MSNDDQRPPPKRGTSAPHEPVDAPAGQEAPAAPPRRGEGASAAQNASTGDGPTPLGTYLVMLARRRAAQRAMLEAEVAEALAAVPGDGREEQEPQTVTRLLLGIGHTPFDRIGEDIDGAGAAKWISSLDERTSLLAAWSLAAARWSARR